MEKLGCRSWGLVAWSGCGLACVLWCMVSWALREAGSLLRQSRRCQVVVLQDLMLDRLVRRAVVFVDRTSMMLKELAVGHWTELQTGLLEMSSCRRAMDTERD